MNETLFEIVQKSKQHIFVDDDNDLVMSLSDGNDVWVPRVQMMIDAGLAVVKDKQKKKSGSVLITISFTKAWNDLLDFLAL